MFRKMIPLSFLLVANYLQNTRKARKQRGHFESETVLGLSETASSSGQKCGTGSIFSIGLESA